MVPVVEKAGDAFFFDFGDNFSACFSWAGVSGGGHEVRGQEAGNEQAEEHYFIGLIFSCPVQIHIADDNC